MRTLGVDTATLPGSVALLEDGVLLMEHTFSQGERVAERLVIRLQQLLNEVGWGVSQLDLIGLTIGPGSFTGLRVGVTLAKMLAYATGCHVVPVETHLAIAAGVETQTRRLLTLIDGQRNGLHVGQFEISLHEMPVRVASSRMVPSAEFPMLVDPRHTLAGPGMTRISPQLLAGATVLPIRDWYPRAAVVGRLAIRSAATDRPVDIWGLLPSYSSPSSAEQAKPVGLPPYDK